MCAGLTGAEVVLQLLIELDQLYDDLLWWIEAFPTEQG
jgi:hypothetical protein